MRQSSVAAVVLFASVAVWACSSSSPAPAPASQKNSTAPSGKAGSGGAAPSGGAAAAASGSAASAGPDDEDVGGKPDDACAQACDQKNPAGAAKQKASDDAFTACLCGAGGCGTACGATSACKQGAVDPQDGDACDTCLAGTANDTCGKQADTTCSADADCKALADCYAACPGANDAPAPAPTSSK